MQWIVIHLTPILCSCGWTLSELRTLKIPVVDTFHRMQASVVLRERNIGDDIHGVKTWMLTRIQAVRHAVSMFAGAAKKTVRRTYGAYSLFTMIADSWPGCDIKSYISSGDETTFKRIKRLISMSQFLQLQSPCIVSCLQSETSRIVSASPCDVWRVRRESRG